MSTEIFARLALDVIEMHRNIGDARPDQCLREAARGLFDVFIGAVAAEVIGVLLRPSDRHAGDRPAVDEVLLVLAVEVHDGLGGLVDAAVFIVRADVVPPGLNSAGEAREHPAANLVLWLGGKAKLRGAVLIHRHAFGNDLVPSQHAVNELAAVGIFGEPGGIGARLAVEQENFRALGDGLDVAEAGGLPADAGAVHADPEAIFSAGFARDAIVGIPQLHSPGVVPLNPLAVDRVVPVALGGEILAGAIAKFGDAVFAVADAAAIDAVPDVVGEPLRAANAG